jgi:repressor of nif and glnA expression
MSTAVKPQPVLSEAEWALVVELLERERGELPAEIHHTRTSALREQLRQRLEMVEGLLARLRGPAAS